MRIALLRSASTRGVMKKFCVFSFLFLIGFALNLIAEGTYKEIEVKNGGVIHGRVLLKGTPPPPEVIPVSKDMASCGKEKTLSSLTIDKNGGVQDVIVGLDGVTEGKKMPRDVKVQLSQMKCEYTPHILIVPRDGTMEIVNDDALLHNVHAYDMSGKSDAQTGPPTMFNIALPVKGMKIAKPMSQAGLLRMLCDAGHPWMNAYALITEHPYFTITDATGAFTLDNVPPGTYSISVWHEGLAEVLEATKSYKASEACHTTRKVTVTPGGTVNVDFTMTVSQGNSKEAQLAVQ